MLNFDVPALTGPQLVVEQRAAVTNKAANSDGIPPTTLKQEERSDILALIVNDAGFPGHESWCNSNCGRLQQLFEQWDH